MPLLLVLGSSKIQLTRCFLPPLQFRDFDETSRSHIRPLKEIQVKIELCKMTKVDVVDLWEYVSCHVSMVSTGQFGERALGQ